MTSMLLDPRRTVVFAGDSVTDSRVSVLIGINDTWRRYDEFDPTSAEALEASYRALLDPLTCPALPVPADVELNRLARDVGTATLVDDGVHHAAAGDRPGPTAGVGLFCKTE